MKFNYSALLSTLLATTGLSLVQGHRGCGYRPPSVDQIIKSQAREESMRMERAPSAEEATSDRRSGIGLFFFGGKDYVDEDPDGSGTGGTDKNPDGTDPDDGSNPDGGNGSTNVMVPTYVHNIYKKDGTGKITQENCDDMIDLANVQLSNTGVQLELKSFQSIENDAWYDAAEDSQDITNMYSQLKVGGLDTFNVYLKTPFDGQTEYCGYAYLAEDASSVGQADGAIVDYGCVPESDTLAHEFGHWMNLLHTFDGGCSPGDLVDDTPAQAVSGDTGGFECPAVFPDTCVGGERDDLNNAMDYAPEGCENHFSNGQGVRMREAWDFYRKQ